MEKNRSSSKQLLNLIKANVKLIQIISYETLRVHAMLVHAAKELEKTLYIWNRVEGIRKWDDSNKRFVDENTEAQDPNSALDFFKDKEEEFILLLEDFYPDLTEDKPRIIKTIRTIALSNNRDKTLVFSQPFVQLPRELEKEVHIMELPYPDSADIEAIYSL